tara:strand:- start:676 stop:1311 length:636 start_codon:yes stop_codon:yes gene_type:complete
VQKRLISSVLFDFDGVLIDSLPAMQVAWLSVQKEFGIKAEFKQYKEFIGLPFNIILSKLNIDPPLHNSIYQHYSKIASRNKNLINLNPYVEFILSWLSKNSISTGIVTSKDKLRTYELIEYFQLNIKAIITPELTRLGKPSAQPIIYASKELNTPVNQIVFIGDMFSDMLTALNSKCLYLHYLKGYQKLLSQTYGGEISSLMEIAEYIKNF